MGAAMPKKIVPPVIPPEYDRVALLVIDVQHGLFQKSTPIYHAEQLLQNLNTLIERARVRGVPVIYVQHSDPRHLVKGSPAWQLHPRLYQPDHERVIHKLHGNAFAGTNLAEMLREEEVGRLVVTGLVTHGCIRATCQGGRELGYPVTLVTDAHSNYSQDAVRLIEEWHAKLAQTGVTLCLTEEVSLE